MGSKVHTLRSGEDTSGNIGRKGRTRFKNRTARRQRVEPDELEKDQQRIRKLVSVQKVYIYEIAYSRSCWRVEDDVDGIENWDVAGQINGASKG